jgi:hypothetical protein
MSSKTNHRIAKPFVLIIIVNWERPNDTIECIGSITESPHYAQRILVVDNGSTDNSTTLIRKAYPAIDLLVLPKNSGFAGGYNAGIEWGLKTQATHFFLLNNDTVIYRDTISALLSVNWDVVVPKILYFEHPDIIWAAGSRWRRFPPAIVMEGRGKRDSSLYDQPRSLEYATGCALLLRRNVFDSLSGFDPVFKNYMEDYDFCYTLRQQGLTLGYQPASRVLHKESRSLGVQSPRRWYYLGRNTVLFYRKERRFSYLTLWSVLFWFTIRETVNGYVRLLPHFWHGVREGFSVLNVYGHHANFYARE